MIAIRLVADIQEYLPPDTLAWCKDYLARQGFPNGIDGGEVNAEGDRIHRLAYLELRDAVATWQHDQLKPVLYESDKPLASVDWRLDPAFEAAAAATRELLEYEATANTDLPVD